VAGFTSEAFSYSGFSVPSLTFSPLAALIITSFLLSITFRGIMTLCS